MKETLRMIAPALCMCAALGLSNFAVADLITEDFESVTIDTTRWILGDWGDPGHQGTATVDNGQFVVSSTDTTIRAHMGLVLRHHAIGDFDVSVDFSYSYLGGTGWTGCSLWIGGENDQRASIARSINTQCLPNCDGYRITTSSNAEGETMQKAIPAVSDSGRMRITRTGTTWEFYLDQGGGMFHEVTWPTGFAGEVRFVIGSGNNALETEGVPLFSNSFDNFAAEGTFLSAPVEQLFELVDFVCALNLKNGIENALDAKLDTAIDALSDTVEANNVAAIGALGAFINHVEAQSGNHISVADASNLIADANLIISQLLGP